MRVTPVEKEIKYLIHDFLNSSSPFLSTSNALLRGTKCLAKISNAGAKAKLFASCLSNFLYFSNRIHPHQSP